MCQRKYQKWRNWMLLVLQKINKLKVLTAWDTTRSCGFSPLQNFFQTMVYLQQDGRAMKGWNKILNEKKIFLAFTSKSFYPDVLSLIWLLSRDRRPHPQLRKNICVCCHSQMQSEDVAMSARGGNFARGKLPVSIGGSGHWMLLSMSLLCFLFFSPALTCTCQRYIQIHPAFGSSLHTLCPPFVLQLREREKSHLILWLFRFFGDQLGGVLESHALCLNSKAEFILWEEVSSCLKGLVRITPHPQTPLSSFAISAQLGLVILIALLRAWQLALLLQSALSSSLKALFCLVPLLYPSLGHCFLWHWALPA